MNDASLDSKRNAESARYALLRRLQPAMRHQMAGGFQSVTMMAAILEKRLLAVSPDLPALAETSGDVRALATAATHSSLDLIGWIASDPVAHVPLDQGILDALHLVATELSIRGFKCVNQTEGVVAEVAVNHVRGVFVAGLLALTDAQTAPGHLQITAGREGQDMVLTIALTDESNTTVTTAAYQEYRVSLSIYRTMDWDDVEAIAAADGVALKHAAATLELRLPIAAS